MTSDTSEQGLERLIVAQMTTPEGGWLSGDSTDYEREYCVDLAQLGGFLTGTQPAVAESLDLGTDGPTRRSFLARLQGEVTKNVFHNDLRRRQQRIEHARTSRAVWISGWRS